MTLEDGRLEQLSQGAGESLTDPIWSPDGHRLFCTLGSRAAVLLDLRRPLEQRLVGRLPPAGPRGEVFVPAAWSPDGGRLVGSVQRPDAWPLPGLVLHDLASRRYERLTAGGADPTWLSGDRLLYIDEGRIRVLDLATRQSHQVLAPPPYSVYRAASADERGGFLYAVRETDQVDVWMLKLQ